MTTDIPQVPENEYDELICTQCLKVIGWAKCSCEKSSWACIGIYVSRVLSVQV